MRLRPVLHVAALGILTLTACQQDSSPANTSRLPSVAAPPYICEYVPLNAVRLMTGVSDPIVSGRFTVVSAEDPGSGGCFVYQSTENKPKVLDITLSPAGSQEDVELQIRQGARRLPDIVPGAVGYYGQDGSAGDTQAAAVLVRGLDRVIVELIRGVKGRDNAADVVALMRLVAPKLLPAAKKTKG
jgi:hypothetical protein